MRHVDGLIEAQALADEEGVVTALYASAGHDTAPFSFLHHSFLARRSVDQMPTPEFYVYVDREEPRRNARLSFKDERTVITTERVEGLTVAGFPAWMLEVRYAGDDAGETGSATVLRIRATNQEVYRLCAEANWSPDVFIGVKDGCRFGGQDASRCENTTRFSESPLSMLPRAPKWWVTDHFRDLGSEVGVGYELHSHDPAFPVSFTKVALLSSKWGHRLQPLYGATVFQVEERMTQAKHFVGIESQADIEGAAEGLMQRLGL